jgi:hypothetical protein
LDAHPVYRSERLRAGNNPFNRQFIEQIVSENPDVIFYSAHYIVPDIHFSTTINVTPIVFIRHPLLRALSVYRFERARPGNWTNESALKMGLTEWLKWNMDSVTSVECRNTQSCLLSVAEQKVPTRPPRAIRPNEKADPGFAGPERWIRRGNLPLVLERLDTVPVVGVVELFDKSIVTMNAALQAKFPGLYLENNRTNVTKTVADWRVELRDVERNIAKHVVDRFYETNEEDLTIWERYYGALVSLRRIV